ncbi:probable choline permease [Cephalotrichum gorgonifer]|uniref:Probable choline permease n=1 Tax=Cephalotrichum gorgonifer TaxID=2041049 RepID=A0AAE8T0B8_9PEZI|nr:probable choline permease [Cephalotrichum gorgonifer]
MSFDGTADMKGPTADDVQLAAMGHGASFKRQFSKWSMLGLSFAILNSWAALAAGLPFALPSGGPVAVLYGLVAAGISSLCLAVSMAEFLSAYPTAGGQYHWVAVISPTYLKRGLSWVTGWISLAGWLALVAVNSLIQSQLIFSIVGLLHPDYESQTWHQFLVYLLVTAIACLINIFGYRLLPHCNTVALVWSLAGFVVISITVIATAAPDYATPAYVFTEFKNTTGWPDGVAWLLGLLQSGLGLTAFDAVAHMIEEIPSPSTDGPKILIYSQFIGISSGFCFLIVLLFASGGAENADTIISSPVGPLLEIFYLATSHKVGAACLLVFPLICFTFACWAALTTSSRITFAFARDGALPMSRLWWKVDQKFGVPVNALCINVAVVVAFGCIFLGSTVAFNAITASAVVSLGMSYAIPIAINMAQSRRALPERVFELPNWLGWTVNSIGLGYTCLTTVLFLFPPALPVTGTSMNYCVVAFAVVILISGIQWVVDGRKNYEGPRVTIDLDTMEGRHESV